MNKWLVLSGVLLGCGIAVSIGQQVALKPEATHTLITPGKVALEWTFHDESRVWLEARSFNAEEWAKEGYHPSFVYLYVKDYRPIVKEISKGKWQITFHSEIATDIP